MTEKEKAIVKLVSLFQCRLAPPNVCYLLNTITMADLLTGFISYEDIKDDINRLLEKKILSLVNGKLQTEVELEYEFPKTPEIFIKMGEQYYD